MRKSRRNANSSAKSGWGRLFVGPGEIEATIMCEGCRDRRDLDCAACGAPAAYWTEAGDGKHAVAWCQQCHALLVSGRPENAPPLVYLPSIEPAIA